MHSRLELHRSMLQFAARNTMNEPKLAVIEGHYDGDTSAYTYTPAPGYCLMGAVSDSSGKMHFEFVNFDTEEEAKAALPALADILRIRVSNGSA